MLKYSNELVGLSIFSYNYVNIFSLFYYGVRWISIYLFKFSWNQSIIVMRNPSSSLLMLLPQNLPFLILAVSTMLCSFTCHFFCVLIFQMLFPKWQIVGFCFLIWSFSLLWTLNPLMYNIMPDVQWTILTVNFLFV